jgi:hypothetical protein
MRRRALSTTAAAIIVIILIVAIVGAAYFYMASQPPPPAEKPPEEKPPAEKPPEVIEFTISSGTTGAVWFTAGGAVADILTTNVPNLKATNIAGGGVTNMYRVNAGEADMGWTYITTLRAGLGGGKIGPVQVLEKPTPNLAAVLRIKGTSTLHVIARADLGVDTLEEIVQKKMALRWVSYPTGTSIYQVLRVFFKLAYDVDFPDDLKEWGGTISFVPGSQNGQMLKDGMADVSICTQVAGHAWIQEVMLTGKFKLLKISNEAIEKMVSIGLLRDVIKAGSYPNQDYDVPTFADSTTMIIRKDLPESLVYEITKAIVENRDKLAEAAPAFAIDPNTAWKGIQDLLHPGAAKYFKEKGYMP